MTEEVAVILVLYSYIFYNSLKWLIPLVLNAYILS